MQAHNMTRSHGGVRGANLSRSSLLFGGPFGRIFRALPPADFGSTDEVSLENLDDLADKMTSAADPGEPSDGPDDEESGIPAAYTYFGQFIDHDLTFDPASSLQKQNDPDALVDYRTPRFDLDNIYGRGPDDQPYLYDGPHGRTFILGAPLHGGSNGARDLQRNVQGRALIGDPRNDENVIVSQLQGLFHRFHNRIAKENPTWEFPRIQQEVRFHYQWILLHDFLPAIIDQEVLGQTMPSPDGELVVEWKNLRFFHFKNFPFMPLEFSAAAYRFGHSMVRPGYRLNDQVGPLPLFAVGPHAEDMRGFKAPRENWALDWRRFIDLEPLAYGSMDKESDPGNQNRLQFAYRLDTSLVNPLSHLPASVAVNPSILAQRNLQRGWRMRLPSGQDVASAMGLEPLHDDQIKIGKFKDKPEILANAAHLGRAGKPFAGNCPLWTYILAETVASNVTVKTKSGEKQIQTRKLGPVGGGIVAETFLGLLLGDSSSYVCSKPLWKPSLSVNGVFGLRELILYALQDQSADSFVQAAKA